MLQNVASFNLQYFVACKTIDIWVYQHFDVSDLKHINSLTS
jgi:hypothetical protein